MKVNIKPVEMGINIGDIQRISPVLEDLQITPTEQEQQFVGAYGIVSVSKIPDEYVTANVENEILNLTRVTVEGEELVI